MKVSGGIRIDLAEQPKGIYLVGEQASISRLKDGTSIPSQPFMVMAHGKEVDVHSVDFSIEGAPYAPVLPSGVSIHDNVITINPSLVTFKTLSIRASSEDSYYQDVFTIVVVEDGDKGDNGTNYLLMDFWIPTISYRLSDLGIPVVKVPDGTSLGYSVYSLKVEESTAGLSPSHEEWDLVESSQFMYMQDAYIERLQAAIVTAEMIEALHIKTGNLEVTNGAKIAGLGVEGEVLASSNKRLVIDGAGNMVYLLDENMNIKTIIRPNNIPTSVASFFSGTGGGSASIAGVKGTLTSTTSNLQSAGIYLDASGGRAYEVSVPEITLYASIDYRGSGLSAFTQLDLYLTNGAVRIPLGSAWAASGGGIVTDTRVVPASTRVITATGTWRLRAELQMMGLPGESGSLFHGQGTVSSTATTFSASEVVNRSEIGSNGMMIATSSQNYNFMVGGTFEVRRGNYMLRVNSSGIQKSTNGGTSWTSL